MDFGAGRHGDVVCGDGDLVEVGNLLIVGVMLWAGTCVLKSDGLGD